MVANDKPPGANALGNGGGIALIWGYVFDNPAPFMARMNRAFPLYGIIPVSHFIFESGPVYCM